MTVMAADSAALTQRSERKGSMSLMAATEGGSASAVILLVLLAWWVFVIWAVSRSAKKRGRDAVGWGALAALIGLFAYIPLWIVGVTDGERERRAILEERARLRVREGPEQAG